MVKISYPWLTLVASFLETPHIDIEVCYRVGIDLIKLIKSSIKSLIKSMRINQGIDLFDYMFTCDHRCMALHWFGRLILGKRAEI